MTRFTALLRLGAVCACTIAITGCISLLPKTEPSQLYRFGQAVSAEAPTATAAGQVGVFRATGTYQRESAGDRILTLSEGKAAYVAQSRWVAPAQVLWDQALLAAFDAAPGRARLISRGEPATFDYVLRIDVRNFETHYDAGPKAAPTVVVRVRAAITRRDQTLVGEQMFEARVRAGDNRVSAIVAAYDEAVGDVMGKLVAWTNSNAG